MTTKLLTAYGCGSLLPIVWLWTDPDYGPLFGVLLVGVLGGGALYLWKAIERRQRTQLLKDYAAIVKPLFVYQESENDQTVFIRAERHRALLKESENKLYAEGLIEVIEHYFQDPNFDYCENFEEYRNSRSDFERDYLRAWAKKTWGNDDIARKRYLHNQLIPS